MRYFVTFDEFDANEKPLAAAIDEGPAGSYELDDAIVLAYRLLDEGKHNVTIRDGHRNSISGDDLIACYNGDKKMTADLKAVPNISN
jgi:hypothetical protein